MTARVLVVDDLPTNVKLLEARLSAEYFDVITATSGEEALAICERAKCDIALLDVMMPDMDGFEVCRRLKAGVSTHHIPVIMVTALDQPSDRVKGLEVGADDFLTKPVSDVALIARVRSLARRAGWRLPSRSELPASAAPTTPQTSSNAPIRPSTGQSATAATASFPTPHRAEKVNPR
jgi:DNA-binding response OmpR family regulator